MLRNKNKPKACFLKPPPFHPRLNFTLSSLLHLLLTGSAGRREWGHNSVALPLLRSTVGISWAAEGFCSVSGHLLPSSSTDLGACMATSLFPAPPPLPFICQTELLPFLKPISLKHPALAAELNHALCWGPCSDWHRVDHGLFPQSPPWQLLADSTLPCKQSTVLQTDNRIWHWEHDSTVEQRCNCGEKLRLEAW